MFGGRMQRPLIPAGARAGIGFRFAVIESVLLSPFINRLPDH